MSRPPSTSVSVRPAHRSTASAAGAPSEEICSDLAREMRQRWHAGERPPAEAFFARDPVLAAQPEAAVELIYEEFCLRDAAGDANAEQDLLSRFPQWAGPLRVMVDCHRSVLQARRERPRFPAAGERVGDFQLSAEVARGSRGRVFLATQAALADRPVVLKVTPLDGGEHLSLARMQHTNIVPLYSVVDDAVRNVRVLCMPYFGRATLASVMELLAPIPMHARAGKDVVAAIDRLQDDDAATSTSHLAGAARQMLANVTYVQAMCWIGACLADALHYAHERGVVHLDLKPSNVLLAADGQPMLLDFHLAREPIRPGGRLPENIGGTPPYMPPEQQSAMRALQEGQPIDLPVDARADVFALGAILYESLGGRLPIAADSPPLSRVHAQVTPGLSDIIARCVAASADARYPAARSLADDLRHHLTDQPLAGVANRSLRERWHKWRRRRPRAGSFAVAAAAVALLLASAWQFAHERHAQAEATLSDGQNLARDPRNLDEAVQSFERGVGLLSHMPFEGTLRAQLHDQLDVARRQRVALQLHRLADEVRALYGSEALAPAHATSLAARCGELWRQRDVISKSLDRSPQVAADLQDIAIFAAHVSAKPEAARILDEAEAAFGASAVLDQECRRHGLPSSATRAPRTAWEHYAVGRSLLAADDLDRAAEHLAAARAMAPADRWANFYYGLCAYRTNRPSEAVAAFSACIGASPDVAGCYYNRALAYAAMGQPEQAIQDYGRALQLDPGHLPALLNRGMLHFEQRRWDRALADLDLALQRGGDPGTVHYDLALVHNARNDRSRALAHLDQALKSSPTHQRAGQLRDTLREELTAAKSSIR